MRDLKSDLEICEKATIPGFPGYKADELGNIWSVEYNWRGYGERILTPYIDKNGYYKVRLSIDGKRIKKTVHRLVCMAFYGEPECNKNIVRHLNGNKKDNTPANLCWGTQQENEADSIRLGEKACGINNGAVKFREKVSAGSRNYYKNHPEKIRKGQMCYNAKLTNEQAREMQNRFRNGETVISIAREMNLNYQTAYAICRERRYKNA